MSAWNHFVDGVPHHQPAVIDEFVAAGWWGDATVYSEFRSSAMRTQQAVAIVDGSLRITYSDLLRRVDSLADGLAERGIGRSDVVAVQLPNWNEFVETALACARLGAIFCPLNSRLRAEVEYVLRLTSAKMLITAATHHNFDHQRHALDLRHSCHALQHIAIARGSVVGTAETFEGLHLRTPASDPCTEANEPWELFFTSGTTSMPKGVIRTPNNTLYTLRCHVKAFQLVTHGDIHLAVLPISFIFPYYLSVLSPLLNGGCTVLQDGFDPALTIDLIAQNQVTTVAIVPSMVERLIAARRATNRDISSLRILQPAAEVVSSDVKRMLTDAFACDVREVYGLTEVTWPIAHYADDPPEKKLSTAGALAPGTELRIVSEDGAVLDSGQEGEAVLRGPSLFPGYFHNPEATSSVIDDDGWFRTGDLAVFEDGFLRIVGRVKDVINRAGVKIAPQEVEEALHAHPAIAAAAVVPVASGRTGDMACACVVRRSGAQLTEEELLDYLRPRLASFKLPERIVFLPSLPLSNTGKILRRTLREHVENLPDIQEDVA